MDGPEQKCMELTTSLLRILGSWPRWSQMSKFSEKLYLCYTIFAISCMSIYVLILTYGFVTDNEWSFRDMHIEDIIIFSTGLISFLKMLMLIKNQKQIQEVIDYINFNLNKRHVLTEADRKVIMGCIRHENILIKLYVGLAGVMVLLFTGSSFLKMARESWTDSYDTKLPLKYSFTINDFTFFIICYLHQFVVMVLNGEVGTLADAIFSCLVYYVCGHLTIVKNRFLIQNMFIEKSCIAYHQEIIRLIAWVERIFQRFLLFMISVNSFLICLGLLQLTQTGTTKRLSYEKSVVYLSIKLSQLFLYCWYGEEITQRSAEVNFACYSTQWYAHLRERNSLDFRFVLHRTQKPIQMRTGFFFSASILTLKSRSQVCCRKSGMITLETASRRLRKNCNTSTIAFPGVGDMLKVMNTAYSFFTMLSSMRK